MKKLVLALAVIFSVSFVSCNQTAEQAAEATDSVAVEAVEEVVDSAAAVVDSAAAVVDSAAAVVAEEAAPAEEAK